MFNLRTNGINKVCQWHTTGRWFSLVSSANIAYPQRYNWNIVESGVKHYKPNHL
jgi:hypothetical protein